LNGKDQWVLADIGGAILGKNSRDSAQDLRRTIVTFTSMETSCFHVSLKVTGQKAYIVLILELAKTGTTVDVEKYEAETRASKDAEVEKIKVSKEADIEKIQASKDAEIEKIRAERDKTQVERAQTQADRQEIEDKAKSDREERDRRQVHAAELAEEKRRQEIRRAAADNTIPPAVAEELLEQWISKILKCPNASKCSSELKLIVLYYYGS
jgi:hypothetical protein